MHSIMGYMQVALRKVDIRILKSSSGQFLVVEGNTRNGQHIAISSIKEQTGLENGNSRKENQRETKERTEIHDRITGQCIYRL